MSASSTWVKAYKAFCQVGRSSNWFKFIQFLTYPQTNSQGLNSGEYFGVNRMWIPNWVSNSAKRGIRVWWQWIEALSKTRKSPSTKWPFWRQKWMKSKNDSWSFFSSRKSITQGESSWHFVRRVIEKLPPFKADIWTIWRRMFLGPTTFFFPSFVGRKWASSRNLSFVQGTLKMLFR